MGDTSRLNKDLWANVTRLKLYAEGDKTARFILEKNPFDNPEEEEATAEINKYVISGRVFPTTGLYKDTGFRIEIKLPSLYPQQAPEIRFVSSIYHPNVEKDGTFCHAILNSRCQWRKGTTLVDVIRIVVKYVNEPDPDYAINTDIAREYLENSSVYNRKALEAIKSDDLSPV